MIVTNERESLSLHDRRRLRDMKRVQREAVRRFTERGFAAVTVEEIAAAAEVSPMSVYRWFGTKEALVVWDEFDPPILTAVSARLRDHGPLDAVRDALIDLLDEVYDRERANSLERAQLIFREPDLLAAADQNSRGLRTALAGVFVDPGRLPGHDAQIAAAVAVALLDTAVDRWQRDDGRRPLADLLREAFDAHEALT